MNLRSKIITVLDIVRGRPFVLFHKPTARCDCRCRFCDFWVGQPKEDDTIPSQTILGFIEKARRAGMTTYTVWGGEPFVCGHLPEWVARAQAVGMETVVCTSGTRLFERAKETAPHIDRLLLSLEAVGEKHDRGRGTPGLFDKIVAGVEAYRKAGGGEIIIWSNLTRDNMDQAEAVSQFAAEHNAFVEFFPAASYAGYNEKLILSQDERSEVFTRVMDLKRQGLPVHNTDYALELMRSGHAFRCNIPKLSIQLGADGKIWPCEARVIPDLKPYGTIDTLEPAGLVRSREFKETSSFLTSCNRCLLPCVGHMADNILLQALRKA